MSKHSKKIIDAFKGGFINSFLVDKLNKALDDNIPDAVVDMALDDAKGATSMGVENDYDYNLNYYINHLLDDILDDTFDISLDSSEKEELKKFLFNNRKNPKYNLSNLTDLRILINSWLSNSVSKKAYPNVGVGIHNRSQTYDLSRWIDALKKIYDLNRTGRMDKIAATNMVISDWDSTEQYKFLQWMKFYEADNTMKYNIKTANFTMPNAWMTPEQRASDSSNLTTFQAKKDQDKQNSINKRKQMRSRISSIRKLLGEYSDLNPVSHDHISELLSMLTSLEARVMSLQTEAMVKSCIVKTANIMANRGFNKGASELYKIAEEPLPGVPSEEKEVKPQAKNVDGVIKKLEEISKFLKSRQIIRELAATDLNLDDLGIASYFPEIGDSQSRLIESFGYASNRIESVIAKLRGTGGSEIALQQNDNEKSKKLQEKELSDINKSKEIVQPPQAPVKEKSVPTPAQDEKIKTNDLMEKPVGEVKTQLPG